MIKNLLLIAMSTFVFASENDSAAVKDEFAKKWAEISAKIESDKQGQPSGEFSISSTPIEPQVNEEEAAMKENRVFQEKLNLHTGQIKKDMLDREVTQKATLEVEPQYIEIAGKSEYYLPYKTFLEVRLYFATKEQNKYSLSQVQIQSQELQTITQEQQMMLQQDIQNVGTTQAATIIPSKPVAKKERVWLNKDYGTFTVSKISPESVVFQGK